ncbi:MAG: hypothetical protein C0614_04090 [Desulfuromonas sp.]|nr:MAG: hypothetical protein C0614_04090 [Desulfuromonas sp.]
MTELRRESLSNGLELSFVDRSNRYFGDYHRLQIEVHIAVQLPKVDTDADDFWSVARRVFGDHLTLVRTLERMGVAGDQVAATREQLVSDYLQHAVPYLERPQSLRALVAGELKRRKTGRRYG